MLTQKSSNHARKETERVIVKNFPIELMDLYSKRRYTDFTKPRFVAYYILRKHFNLPLTEIARIFKRNHTSIISGIAKAKKTGLDKQADWIISAELSTYPQP